MSRGTVILIYTPLFLFLLGNVRCGQDASLVFQWAPLMGNYGSNMLTLRLQPHTIMRNLTLASLFTLRFFKSLPALGLLLRQLALQAQKFSFEQKMSC